MRSGQHGFHPRVVNAYEERIRGLARGILATAFEQDAFDWVESVAAELPMWVFSEIMGLPVEDRRLIIELGDKILGNTDPEVVGEGERGRAGAAGRGAAQASLSSPFSLDLIEYGRALGERRRADPRDDITTKLVEAELDGSRLSEQEFGVMFILLTTAGNETTRHTISLGLHDLLTHPDELRRLVDDPSLAGTAADELAPRAPRTPLPPHRDAGRGDARPADQGGGRGGRSGTPRRTTTRRSSPTRTGSTWGGRRTGT